MGFDHVNEWSRNRTFLSTLGKHKHHVENKVESLHTEATNVHRHMRHALAT